MAIWPRARCQAGVTDAARSAQMARIRAVDTKPEMIVRRAFHAAGLRFRLHDRRLPGTPDIVFPSRRVAVEVRGCFWHRHADPMCRLARLPKSRLDFWLPKLERNTERDQRKAAELAEMGWRLHVVWECQIRNGDLIARLIEEIRDAPVTISKVTRGRLRRR